MRFCWPSWVGVNNIFQEKMVFSSTVHDQFCFQSDIHANVDILETTDKILVNIKSIPVEFS